MPKYYGQDCRKISRFLDYWYVFRPSQSNGDFLTVASGRIARDLIGLGKCLRKNLNIDSFYDGSLLRLFFISIDSDNNQRK